MDCFLKQRGFGAALKAAFVLSLFLGGANAFAEDQPCPFDVPQTDLKVASCVQEGNVNILKLVPRNEPGSTNDFDNLPTYVVSGKNLQDILAVVGIDSARRYNKLIEVPHAEELKEFSDAAPTAKALMKQRGWTLLDMKNVIYPGPDDVEGFSLTCNTLQAETAQGFVVVSQCNTFYEEGVSDLKKLLARITCEPPKSEAFPALNTDSGTIVFNYTKLPENESQDPDDVAIDVDFVNCADGAKKNIAGLPFLAATGAVKAAFLATTKPGAEPELIIIHAVGIRADTGVNYLGDYYTVHVYANAPAGYVRDERLSTYFGNGDDIARDAESEELVYTFPYKTADAIVAKLNSAAYKHWAAGDEVKLTINKKTSIYSSPVLAEVTKMYLINGDSVLQEGAEAGFLKIMFKTPKGKAIRGWVLCGDADGC
ncbi:hypothetical protein [Pseudomonas nunensis]|uniref:Uncharacterized protein n=1 Tax=Pseudomonas nunensis TaxID=2961896 RepID=A0ABY5ERW5_9PSED|nr:hypothetical protein [Pseudomonas nunensis]KPN88338.1 hypothetical protein AL066_29370 [Pseudomonas nunensis]MCL5226014.1 hypothetical protein [Pseudomonas nunensis]UTO17933.1 hypothetical protein NK667_28155 [Pseudomonas nunensis]